MLLTICQVQKYSSSIFWSSKPKRKVEIQIRINIYCAKLKDKLLKRGLINMNIITIRSPLLNPLAT